jgi:hypothetical protein
MEGTPKFSMPEQLALEQLELFTIYIELVHMQYPLVQLTREAAHAEQAFCTGPVSEYIWLVRVSVEWRHGGEGGREYCTRSEYVLSDGGNYRKGEGKREERKELCEERY